MFGVWNRQKILSFIWTTMNWKVSWVTLHPPVVYHPSLTWDMLKCHFSRLKTWGSVMIVPIVLIPSTIADGLRIYRNLFPRSETYRHIEEYCTGLVVLDKPSIQRMSQCLVNGSCQSSLNKAITSSPWSEQAVNQRRIESIAPYHHPGFTVGIVDSTFIHHPRGQTIYGVYK